MGKIYKKGGIATLFSDDITFNTATVDKILNPQKSFDIIRRDLLIADRLSVLYFTDGFIKDTVFEKVLEFLLSLKPDDLKGTSDMENFAKKFIPYAECSVTSHPHYATEEVLSGPAVLLIDGIRDALIIDTREYPVRSITEPDKDRSLRGSRDGFAETLIFNTAMVRRRIKDPNLRMEYAQVGNLSKIGTCICYIDGKAPKSLVTKLKCELSKINLDGVSMISQAIAEKLAPTAFFNPFPKIRYTERPDYASATVLEGKILLIFDNSPQVMIFPTTFADFSKEADDYYFPPLVGSYIRTVRFIISIVTVILTPLTLLLLKNPQYIPQFLSFIKISDSYTMPLFWQFLLLEFIIDGLRLASLNTPDSLSNSLGIIGGLLLSEFAIKAGWFCNESILYMAFVAISGFTQPSFEMGYAMKFVRMFTLILTEIFGFFGFFGGIILSILCMLFTKTVGTKGYLYPIFPFNLKDFLKLFIRTKIKH